MMQGKRIALAILVLAGVFASQVVGAPPGRPSSRPFAYKPVPKPGPGTSEFRIRDPGFEVREPPRPPQDSEGNAKGALSSRYENALLLLSLQPGRSHPRSQDAIRELAARYAEAKHGGKIERLDGDLSWLSMYVTGDAQKDQELKQQTRQEAERYFSHPWRQEKIKVLATGLSRDSLISIQEASGHDNATKTQLLGLQKALSTFDGQSTGGRWEREVADAIRPFKGELLILVAHHSQGKNNATGTILVQHSRNTVQVPVDALDTIARAEGVNLFLLGCATSSSTGLGTYRPLSAAEAISGIEKIFSDPISTYGQVYQRLVREGVDIVFDISLSAEGIFDIVIPSTKNVIDRWKIPDVQAALSIPKSSPTSKQKECTDDAAKAAASLASCLAGGTGSEALGNAENARDLLGSSSSRQLHDGHQEPPVARKPFVYRAFRSALIGLEILFFTIVICGFCVWLFADKILRNDFSPSILGNDEHNNPYSCLLFIYVALIAGAGYLVSMVLGMISATTDSDSTPIIAALIIVSGIVVGIMPLCRFLKRVHTAIRHVPSEEDSAMREALRRMNPN